MRIILCTILFFLNFLPAFSQDIAGKWPGNIEVNNNKIPIVFHFYTDASGKLQGKWDSPTQNANNLPCSDINIEGDSITVDLKIISGYYNGKFIGNDSIAECGTRVWGS
ncbi:MAG: hypothetical protein ABIN25_10205 [Ginsengibacter sp.]